ncbi:MAG: alkaline phosphatase family protein [Flavobacteriia bacterium]|nr:alkaline phosphatase family protein [Flavobacteriia bacterium]OIP48762.1 MAG: alkaline phosphatase [Flavobacteriaceae bacterium CG2_30_31_66]PIV95482.1 MAG: alkaline phosphatase [Flavobacteriaceae bacterium CG17_big_fil_post_rev_8_21_14_2_50_31_13]PIX13268.1 MAG: alkaline phosphatase [Flavobacteriaceae bacterium CG_4_8_14_3_um_filter_31_8]PIY14191.1 MAG: alkaline phosphatase [Flavobacteriaceae bacterium CG_4_10_14_3_um_filter_31_253]PIZ10300.1 MAG: alkaline phosphatase [Flavobacteriaceae ba
MKKIVNLIQLFSIVYFTSCAKIPEKKNLNQKKSDFVIAFGSCNKQFKTNALWQEIAKNKPNLWIWGGDNIYADTNDMKKMKQDYIDLKNQNGYVQLTKKLPVLATWDDHDYGLNDAGVEFSMKKESQKLFLDFFDVLKNDVRRTQEGIYHSQIFSTKKGSIKVIVLDTRYFRTSLTKAKNKRYQPNTFGDGTILGTKQWNWLENELSSSKADFNVIVSSIQFLSSEHGFETWGNFPHEVEKMKNLILKSLAKNVLFLSGDRHISEFSKTTFDGLKYPIIDFTSSGLTHSYTSYSFEPNKYRIKNVVNDISFGILHFDFKNKSIKMQMRGKQNTLQQEFNQVYQ